MGRRIQPVAASMDQLLALVDQVESTEPMSPPSPPKLYAHPLAMGVWRALLGMERRIVPAPVPYLAHD